MIAVNDPGSTRLVYAMVIGLVVVGVALVLLGVWLVRQTRYDPPVLAPLERMGDDSWRTSDPATQRRILDEVRPEGAEPLAAGTAPPTLDAEFDAHDRPVPEFDDLRPGLSSSEPSPFANNGAGEPAEDPATVDTEHETSDDEASDDAGEADDLRESGGIQEPANVEVPESVEEPVTAAEPSVVGEPGGLEESESVGEPESVEEPSDTVDR